MALLEIKKYPDAVLQQKTEPVSEYDAELQKLIDDMIETMYAAPGVGLAANQVGVSMQLAVIDVSARDGESSLMVIINPEIVCLEGEEAYEEGCLSLPDYTTVVKRAMKVTVKGTNRHQEPLEIEAEGILARALQHEIDHLNGVLLIDRIGRIKKEFFKKRYARDRASSRKD